MRNQSLIKVFLYITLAMLFVSEINAQNDYLSYFDASYSDCRNEFKAYAKTMAGEFQKVEYSSINVPGKTDNELYVDLLYIPAQQSQEKLLILSSGTHGIEGFVGSAMQEMFVSQFLTEDLLKNTGVLLIHGLNPYGFKYFRRVTENNIDLNRNSDISSDLYDNDNSGYAELYDFLNPQKAVKYGSMGNRFFAVKAIKKIVQASLPVLRQAVLQGQYEFQEGLYFGGSKVEPQIAALGPIIQDYAKDYEVIMNIDLHTGYGERGKLHFFPNPVKDPVLRQKTEKLFEGYQIDWGDSGDFYTITGDFSGFIGKLLPGKTHIAMTFEYGTMDSQKTMGSIRSIKNMILENQGVHNGYKKDKDRSKVEKNILEMYYPSDPEWRKGIMVQTEKVFETLFSRFADL